MVSDQKNEPAESPLHAKLVPEDGPGEDDVKPASFFIRQKEILVNLLLMCYLWTTI